MTAHAVAGRLIGEMRQRVGLSQAALARRVGLPRSVVNAYERGHRQPSVEALQRIAAAVGFEVHVRPVVRRLDDRRAARILGQVLDLAEELPARRRGRLAYPPFARRVGA